MDAKSVREFFEDQGDAAREQAGPNRHHILDHVPRDGEPLKRDAPAVQRLPAGGHRG